MADVVAELLSLLSVRRVVLEASLGRQVAERQRRQAELAAVDMRLASLAGAASALRDEALRRERERPAAAAVAQASAGVLQFRRPLVLAQREAIAAMHEEAVAHVAQTNRALLALGEREAVYRRLAQHATMARDELADDDG